MKTSMRPFRQLISASFIFIIAIISSYGSASSPEYLVHSDAFNTSFNSELSNNLKPTFENVPVWRLQLRVKTDGKKNANTDNEVYVKFTPKRSSKYYLDRAGDDREKNKVNTYDIIDKNIKTISDIEFMYLMITGNDGWCVKSVELLINDIKKPVFSKQFKTCKWLDGDQKSGPSLYIPGKELRKSSQWKYTGQNRAIWLPPMLISRATMEAMVESFVGHLMNDRKEMRKLEFGKKKGRAYVEAKKIGVNKLRVNLDLEYSINNFPNAEADVNFDLVFSCKNNTIDISTQNIKGKGKYFGLTVLEKEIANFSLGSTYVQFCPTIKVKPSGDISIRP